MTRAEPGTTRLGLTLMLLGTAPFAAGAALGGLDGPRVCPFSTVTGIPCPLCGSTRSFALAAHGDPAFLQFNAVWVAVAAAVALAGVAALALARAGRGANFAVPAPWLWRGLALVAALAWGWALVQRDVIVA